jgi:hypothetical protein
VNAIHDLSQDTIDAALERDIQTVHRLAMAYAAEDSALAREAFSLMTRLIGKRSKAQIDRMQSKIEGLRR